MKHKAEKHLCFGCIRNSIRSIQSISFICVRSIGVRNFIGSAPFPQPPKAQGAHSCAISGPCPVSSQHVPTGPSTPTPQRCCVSHGSPQIAIGSGTGGWLTERTINRLTALLSAMNPTDKQTRDMSISVGRLEAFNRSIGRRMRRWIVGMIFSIVHKSRLMLEPQHLLAGQ